MTREPARHTHALRGQSSTKHGCSGEGERERLEAALCSPEAVEAFNAALPGCVRHSTVDTIMAFRAAIAATQPRSGEGEECGGVGVGSKRESSPVLSAGADPTADRLVRCLEERVLRTPEPTPKQEALMEQFSDEMPTWAQLAFVQSENERMREEVRQAIAGAENA